MLTTLDGVEVVLGMADAVTGLPPALELLASRISTPGMPVSGSLDRLAQAVKDDPDLFTGCSDDEAQERLLWTFLGWPAALAAQAREDGMSVDEAHGWKMGTSLTPAATLEWWAALRAEGCPDATTMAEAWNEVLIEAPADRPEGMDPRDMAFWLALSPADDQAPRWTLHGRSPCPAVASAALIYDREPEEVVDLVSALRGPLNTAVEAVDPGAVPVECRGHDAGHGTFYCEWYADARERAISTLPMFDGVDWSDVASCLNAGLSVNDAIEHVRAGRDMAAVRVMAALR